MTDCLDCPFCGAEKTASLLSRNVEITLRGVSLNVVKIQRVCARCLEAFENSRDPDWRVGAFDLYREKMGLIARADFRAWRENAALSPEYLDARLGWKTGSVTRFERGSLLKDGQNAALAALMTA